MRERIDTVSNMDDPIFDHAAQQVIDAGNKLAEPDESADVREIADGLLAGAIQYWLFSRQPCGEPFCEACEDIDTAEKRLKALRDAVEQLAQSSEYFHSTYDLGVGHA